MAAGIGGAASCSLVNVSRYGPASSSGIAASKIDIVGPNLIAPPLSSPRTLKSCSPVRAWTSEATSSADLPPTRLPSPSAVRPANPSGNAASLAARVTAFRGGHSPRHCRLLDRAAAQRMRKPAPYLDRRPGQGELERQTVGDRLPIQEGVRDPVS